jgi:hypothetical protein
MGKDMFILFFCLIVVILFTGIGAGPSTTDNHIKVDQFGYRPGDEKIAVISNPVTGYNSSDPFTPGNVYQVKRWEDDAVVLRGSPTAWNSGATHAQSGDKAWWFDFSALTASGSYYVYDSVQQVGSYKFDISDCVYDEVLKQALRSYYYQRCGTAKTAACAGAGWADPACHVGTQQDTDCRLYNNTDASTSRDLSGGWHDAGDHNKYVNFAFAAVVDLLLAYQENPAAWGDENNIPESGNGIPDLLDEVKYELDWILKMQEANGSVLCVIGGGGGSPPSADTQFRRYGPATTSATLTASALLAHGAVVFKATGMTAYADTLQAAAVNAWNWADANTGITFYNSGTLAAGEQEVDDYGRLSRKITAACFLFALTGNAAYKTFFESNYTSIHMMAWSYVYPFETVQQDVLLYYSGLPSITASVGTAIRNTYTNNVRSGNADNLPAYLNNTDAYRAYVSNNNYVWGSNGVKGHQAIILQSMNVYGLDAANSVNYSNAALGYINYMHGVNPTAFAYLSNMGAYGAENSINEFYHGWFHDGSVEWDRAGTSTYGPAPGFVPGGPNPNWSLDGCCPSGCYSAQNNALCVTLEPPANQPIQKSYRDWNTTWPQNSWSVTENGIYYQAAYVRALSKFCDTAACGTTGLEFGRTVPQGFIVFPNPAGSRLTIRAKSKAGKICQVKFYSVDGRLLKSVISGKNIRGNFSIDMKGFRQGLYLLKITMGNKTGVQKILKL